MATVIADLDRVYLDTTVFVNLGQAGALIPFVRFVNERARIVREVDTEIQSLSTRTDFAFLKTLRMIRGWPPIPPIDLPAILTMEVLDVKRAYGRPGEHALEHLGEIASVVAAAADGGSAVVSDDGLAGKMCALRDLGRLTTADVALEMAARGELDHESARDAFNLSVKYAHADRGFDEELQEVAAALG